MILHDKEKPQVVRPASIVIRFTNPGRYNKAIAIYTAFLGKGPVRCQPDVFASFQVGSAASQRKKDLEFRLELYPGDITDLRGHTIIYWQIKPWDDEAAVEAIKAQLVDFGYSTEYSENKVVKEESRFIMTDGFDNYFGGHPTPPFPPGGGKVFRKKHRFLRWGSVLVGVLGGLVMVSLVPGVVGLRRAAG